MIHWLMHKRCLVQQCMNWFSERVGWYTGKKIEKLKKKLNRYISVATEQRGVMRLCTSWLINRKKKIKNKNKNK